MKRYRLLLLSVVGAWGLLGTFSAKAAQVLLKEIGGSVYSGAARELFALEPHRWSGGFRTASTANACFITSWTNGSNDADDGLVMKVDAVGGILWKRPMGVIMGGGNWKVNDIAIHGESLYVCGTHNDTAAYVARLSLEGTIQDYSYIDGINGNARATSLALGSDAGQPVVTVVGDAYGDKLSVRERQRSGGGRVFDGLPLLHHHDHPTQRDVFVVSFDANLQAVWSTTLGNDIEGNCYATAVEADNTGALFVGMVMDGAATASGEQTRQIFRGHSVGDRQVYYRTHTGTTVKRPLGIDDGAYGNDFDPHYGSVSAIYRIEPVRDGDSSWRGQEITHHFFPCKQEQNEGQSHSRVTDIVYANGSLIVSGEWEKNLRPVSTTKNASISVESKKDGSAFKSDIWVAKLSASNLADEKWRLYASSGDDYASSLTVGADGSVVLAGVAGGALKTRTLDNSAESDPAGPLASNSSSNHLFWQKLGTATLDPIANWHVTPYEGGDITPPGSQRASGAGIIGETVLITGAWTDGTLVMGPDAARRKTLSTVYGAWLGFVGFLNQSGVFLEEVQIKINSDHGITPQPHLGVNTVAAGKTIVASVPQEVFKDREGNVISSDNADSIRQHAVTRHVCVGYQFNNSEVNGTANTVTFVAKGDTELTFLWRTEHAVEVESNLQGTEGLTSTAAGNPVPSVQKHWIKENDQFTALIDGVALDVTSFGTRWRSLGFLAEGCVAQAQGIASGGTYHWASNQPRQQTNKITVGSPGRIVWQWRKEYSVRVGVNSSIAEEAPTTLGNGASHSGIGEFWFAPDTSVTVSAPASIDSGRSTQALKGYTGGSGAVVPFSEKDVQSKSFALTRPSTIVWDYANRIYVETVTIGHAVTFNSITGTDEERVMKDTKPEGGNILAGPSGISWDGMWRWDAVRNKLYPTVPGTFTVEFKNQSDPDDPAQNIILRIESQWPSVADYTHIVETPPVDLDRSSTDERTFVELVYTDSRASETDRHFSTQEDGRSVLVFADRSGGIATGNLEKETLSVKVVESVYWRNSAGNPRTVPIGSEIDSGAHRVSEMNGYVIDPLAPVNPTFYDRENLQGTIFAVNEVQPITGPVYPLSNPSFERNHFTESPGYVGWNPAISYWTSSAAAGLNPAGDSLFADNGRTPHGDNVAFIQGEGNLVSSLNGLFVGGTYQASFRVNARSGSAATLGVQIDDQDIGISLNGNASDFHALIDPVGGDAAYHTVTFSFTATAASMGFKVTSAAGHGDNALLVDDFRFQGPRGSFPIAWYEEQDAIYWPYIAETFVPQWPVSPDRIVIASRLGSEGLNAADGHIQPLYEGEAYSDLAIYHQPSPSGMGYNPNEEHALLAPSFLDANRKAAFALRRDLNQFEFASHFTSRPYVLTQYVDRSNPNNPVPRMRVYAVIDEDATTVDGRLPPFNQHYTYSYEVEAGLPLLAPHPYAAAFGSSPMPEETRGEQVDNRYSYYEDKNHVPWVVSGDTDSAEDIRATFYYPLRSDFWHHSAEIDSPMALGTVTEGGYNLKYNCVWPEDSAVLKAGETLTFAGGEYASDHAQATPRPKGLPQAVAWQSAKMVFDEANAAMASNQHANQYLARVFPALEAREVPLALTSVPTDLQPASGQVIVDGLLWRFKQLPASLQDRVYYNTANEKLGVRGLLNGRILGDGDLLAAPGAQTILQPNVLTHEDEALIKALNVGSDWVNAVTTLSQWSRDPNGTDLPVPSAIGLERDGIGLTALANSVGPGLVVVTNPALQQPASLGGYITIAENDHADLPDAPVAMHVIKVSTEKYRGSVAVMAPGNVFDEKVSLRHTADFGGNVNDLYFQWYLREEDGRDLNPPGIDLPDPAKRDDGSWVVFKEGKGLSEVQLVGSGPTLITDNLVFCRYGYGDAPSAWSAWAGAANSREPQDATDPPYVAQLVPGWIKRVTEAINLFDARFDDFGNQSAPATYTSAIQQAGQRWEGPVAFNPNKDAIENVGLIELYQTILDRAEDFTIASSVGTDGVNTALLNAANRIASLYTLLGNEAYADAQDPMIGFSTVGGEFGSLAPTLHAFENQTATLLEEELSLLRGRSEVGARPAYNRLMWNFTNGAGEAAYVLNYGLEDLTNDGFLDVEDGRRLYPQGHGDAWGHYTMALKGYYDLAKQANFTWSPRSEKVTIDGIVIDVDYLDERAFAKTASARAQAGAELVDLTYRQAYTENPNGQWQGYQDNDADRAWGVFETAQRHGTAAYCDWLFANSVLPATDTTNTGIRKVDRTTVPELRALAQYGSEIQTKLDQADRGLNPAGLDPNVVSFDIDPVLTERSHVQAATHFEQVYQRATDAAANALRTFDHANEIALQLRRTEATSESLRQQAVDQDLVYRNQLIEIFGTPYEGMIGSGKAYPAGYRGPDLYLWMYVDQTSAGGDILDPLDNTVVETTIVPGLRNLAADTNPFIDGARGVDYELVDTVSKYFPEDLDLPNETPGNIELNLPRQASGYALVAPNGWGSRRSPGAIQATIQELIQAEWRLRGAMDAYESQADDFQNLLKRFELKSEIASSNLYIGRSTLNEHETWRNVATSAFSVANVLNHGREVVALMADSFHEAFPKVVGLSSDATSSARGMVKALHAVTDGSLRALISPMEIIQYRAELEADLAVVELEKELLTQESRSELVDILFEINDMVNGESDALVAVVDALETMRAASDRVRTVIEQGQSLIEERTVFNQRVASTTTKQRYEDFTFRVFQSEALRKYRSAFDVAVRYAYLAGKAYQYELNLPDHDAANAAPILADMLRTRSLGEWRAGEPVLGNGGLADHLATLHGNFETLKGQLGFNNPDTEVHAFSLRRELARIGMSSRVNADWRAQLENWRVPDLWNYEYQHQGVNYGYLFRRYCRPFAAEAAGPQPALVIPFDSTIAAGHNWFGKTLAGGDSAFNTSTFSTKIRAAGVRLDGYNNTALSHTPQVYLIPVGQDRLFLPDSRLLEHRSWNVVDQRIPAPMAINASHLSDPDWLPFSGSAHGTFEDVRKFSSFRAYHDAGGWDDLEMLQSGRLVGRSVWNSQWVLIIPNASLLNDPDHATAGLDTFIHGAPLPGYTQETAELTHRDRVGVRDIRILLQTYSVSGN